MSFAFMLPIGKLKNSSRVSNLDHEPPLQTAGVFLFNAFPVSCMGFLNKISASGKYKEDDF